MLDVGAEVRVSLYEELVLVAGLLEREGKEHTAQDARRVARDVLDGLIEVSTGWGRLGEFENELG